MLGVVGVGLVLAGAARPAPGGVQAVRAAPAGLAPAGHAVAVATGVPDATQPGHRVVRVAIDAATLPPELQTGETVDVLAAVGDIQSGDARVVPVASGVLVAAGSPLAVDVDQAGAERLIWAEAFAKALRILVRPPGDTSSPAAGVSGLGPPGSAQ